MISLEFWQALQRPPRGHTLYKRVIRRDIISLDLLDNSLVVIVGIVAVTILASTTFASIFLFLVLLSIPLLMLRFGLRFGFTGMANGLRWAMASGEALLVFRRNGLYDLLCLTPSGPLGVNWAVSTGVFYRLLEGGRYQAQDLWAGRMYILLPLTLLFASRHQLSDQPLMLLLCMLLYLALVVAWFRLEDTQSITLGGLIGMLIPTYSRNSWEVRISTLGLFALIQISAYSLGLLLAALLADVYIDLQLEGWLGEYSRLALAMLILAALRELAIRILWRRLLLRLNLDSSDQVGTVSLVY